MTEIEKYVVIPVEFYGYRCFEGFLERKGIYIEDTLQGIRDNLLWSRQYKLDILKKRLIGRIITEYSPWIIECKNVEVLSLLEEIRNIVFLENDEVNEGEKN